jgi:uncharacterized RDD family membrane protein YckC
MPPPPPPGSGSTPPPPPPGFGSTPPPPPPGAVATAPGIPAYGYAAPPVGGERANFGIRLGGYLLDGLLYGLLMAVFVIPAFVIGVSAFDGCTYDDFSDEILCPPGEPSGGTLGIAIAVAVVGWLIVAFIYLRALGKTGQTWGRKIVGIKVVGETTGEPIGFGRALGRQLFAGFISAQILYIGYLWMLWDDKQQTWHDKVVNSIVVKT